MFGQLTNKFRKQNQNRSCGVFHAATNCVASWAIRSLRVAVCRTSSALRAYDQIDPPEHVKAPVQFAVSPSFAVRQRRISIPKASNTIKWIAGSAKPRLTVSLILSTTLCC
jgi:hypothetical protein